VNRNGFKITITEQPDPDPDLSYLGEYSDTPHGDRRLSVDVWAVEHGHFANGEPGWRPHPHVYRWFNPAYGCTPSPTLESLRAEHAKLNGGNLDEAYRQVMRERRQDYDRMTAYQRGEWACLGVIVTASLNGVELASASLWGIESDGYDSVEEAAEEHGLIDEAVEQAQSTLAALTKRYRVALFNLAKWATVGDRSGNPYLHEPVREAIRTLGDPKGFDLPKDVESAPEGFPQDEADDVVRALLEWEAQQGGYEATCWARARALKEGRAL
jgi:hypothetical protein